MPRAWRGVVFLVAALLALSLPAQAQTGPLGIDNPHGAAPATLYLHLLGIQDFPINTQVPEPGFHDAQDYGLAAYTLTCLPNPPVGGQPFHGYHTYYGYSSPSYVEYDFAENGRPRIHPERGLGQDIRFDPQAPLLLHWYLESTAPGPSQSPSAPVPLASVVVEATLLSPDALSVDDTAYDTGAVIARGKSTSAVLAGPATQGAAHSVAGDRDVYGFTIPLTLETGVIPRATGYTMRIDVFLDSPVCLQEGAVTPASVRPFMDGDHLPRIQAAVHDQLAIEWLQPVSLANGSIAVHASIRSAWGGYDVDEHHLDLAITHPDGTTAALPPTLIRQHLNEFYHHHEPAEIAWFFDASEAAPGLYVVALEARNDQQTATATATAAFRLGAAPDRSDDDVAYAVREGEPAPDLDSDVQAMPSMSVAPMAALLGVAVATRRLFGNR